MIIAEHLNANGLIGKRNDIPSLKKKNEANAKKRLIQLHYYARRIRTFQKGFNANRNNFSSNVNRCLLI